MLENNRFFVLENNRFSVLENNRFSVLENNRCPPKLVRITLFPHHLYHRYGPSGKRLHNFGNSPLSVGEIHYFSGHLQ